MAIDKDNMLDAIKSFPKQCRDALSLPRGISVSRNIKKIVVAGMGGSAIGGDLLKTFMRNSKIPVYVSRSYKVPGFVDSDTLVFIVSYSGNTEETYSSYLDAYEKKAKIIAITSGGKIADECEKTIKISAGLQPRAALGYLFFPMLGILHNSGIVKITNHDLNEMLELVKETEDFNEEGRALSKKLRDKIPIIYASEKLMPVAMRWKTQINENAKLPAFFNTFSEMNHNEIASTIGMDMRFKVIILRDKNDHPQIKKRMDFCKKIMEQYAEVEEVHTQGNGMLARIFSAILLGDFMSYHLAIWNRVDPSPVEAIEDLKKQLAQ